MQHYSPSASALSPWRPSPTASLEDAVSTATIHGPEQNGEGERERRMRKQRDHVGRQRLRDEERKEYVDECRTRGREGR